MFKTHQDNKVMRGRGLTIFYGGANLPFGNVLIAESDKGLCRVGMDEDLLSLQRIWPDAEFIHDNDRAQKTGKQLMRAWNGDESVPLHLMGTDFQLSVWNALLQIPYGQVSCYQNIASDIGKPKAVRAVGTAIGKNPVPVLVPCHRVIRKDGAIGNFGWGVDVKRHLLLEEGVTL